jgi:hypothetical protein
MVWGKHGDFKQLRFFLFILQGGISRRIYQREAVPQMAQRRRFRRARAASQHDAAARASRFSAGFLERPREVQDGHLRIAVRGGGCEVIVLAAMRGDSYVVGALP